MSLAAALVLVVAAAQAAPATAPEPADRGAQIDSARISVTILRPAVIVNGVLVSSAKVGAPRSQRQTGDGRVTYLFE